MIEKILNVIQQNTNKVPAMENIGQTTIKVLDEIEKK